MSHLRNSDVALLQSLQKGPMSSAALRSAIEEDSAEWNAAHSTLASRWPVFKPGFCSFLSPRADDYGDVAVSGALTRLALFDVIEVADDKGRQTFHVERGRLAHCS